MSKTKKILATETLIVTFINLIVALLINFLAWHFKLVSGGLTGYALLTNLLTGFPTGTILLGMNILLLLLALVLVGKGPGVKGIYGFASFSFFIDSTRYLLNLQQVSTPPFFTSLLYILILSVSMGSLVCVILANNYNVGAYSTIYIVLKNFFEIKAQNLFFALDFTLAFISGLIFGLEKGILLAVNAYVAYLVVKALLPKTEKYFEEFRKQL